MLITPTIIDAASESNERYRRRFDELASSSDEDVRFKLLD